MANTVKTSRVHPGHVAAVVNQQALARRKAALGIPKVIKRREFTAFEYALMDAGQITRD